MTVLAFLAALAAAGATAAYKFWIKPYQDQPEEIITPNSEPMPAEPSQTPEMAPSSPDSIMYPWDSQKHNWHNTRVLCDKAGLSLEQKDTICECIYQESEFLANPKPNQNKDKATGQVWSTDYGIVQVNDYYNIGVGKKFPSVEYVIDNPGECVQWMIEIYKSTGELKPWASWTTGAYKKWATVGSPMWLLAQL
jgi:hypothetical protein